MSWTRTGSSSVVSLLLLSAAAVVARRVPAEFPPGRRASPALPPGSSIESRRARLAPGPTPPPLPRRGLRLAPRVPPRAPAAAATG